MTQPTATPPAIGADGPLGDNGTGDRTAEPIAPEDRRTGAAERRSRLLPVAVVLGVFVLSRGLAYAAGLEFDADALRRAWQILDPALLDDHLLQSVWYLHMQPPLFNLFIGITLEASPFSDAATLHVVWVAMGAGLSVLLYTLGRQLGLGRWTAVVTASVLMCGSTVLLYEHWFQYEYPLMLMVTGCVSAFLRWQRTGRALDLALVCGLAATAVLTRSLFHPLWLVGVVALALVARPLGIRRSAADTATTDELDEPQSLGRRRLAIGAAALVPLVLVGGVMAKNQVLFGRSELSSWFGWNLSRIVVAELSIPEKQQLIDEGTMPPTFAAWLNQPVASYDPIFGPCEPSRPDVPALTEPTKHVRPGPDEPFDNNLNHECYLRVYAAAQSDSLALVKARPRDYARNVVSAFEIWAQPSSDYVFVRKNSREITWVDNAYKAGVLLAVPIDLPVETKAAKEQIRCVYLPEMEPICMVPDGQYRLSLTIVGGTLLAGLLALRGLWLLLRRRDRSQTVWILIGATIVWVTLVGNLFEFQENHRFRVVVEPLTILVVVVVGAKAWRWVRDRRTEAENGESPSTEGLPA